MDKVTKQDLQLRYELFDLRALKDQRWYYREQIERSRRADEQVNRLRAGIALITGIAAALAALFGQAFLATGGSCSADVSSLPGYCGAIEIVIAFFMIVSIGLPAIGAFFSSLSDLYQWDRLQTIYTSAQRNLVIADALSPEHDEPYEDYFINYHTYVDRTLQVMSDETTQWGQAIHQPEKTQQFVNEMRVLAQEVGGDLEENMSDEPGESGPAAGNTPSPPPPPA